MSHEELSMSESAETCGAKARSTGEPCKLPPLKNGRCRFHGGRLPQTNKSAFKHGIYGDALHPGELFVWEKLEVNNLDDEIKLLKIQLRRAAIAQLKYELEGDGLVTTEERDEDTVDAQGGSSKSSRVRKLPDFTVIIDRLSGRIGKLCHQRAQVTGEGENKTPHEWAAEIRGALAMIEETDGPGATMDPA